MTRVLRLALLGGSDLVDSTLSQDEGGRVLTEGLAAVLQARHADLDEVELRQLDHRDVWAWVADPEALRAQIRGVDAVVRSIAPDLESARRGRGLASDFADAMAAFIAACKAEDVRVIVLNGSTYDPTDTVSCYRDASDSRPLAIHRLDLELIELSMLDGISVLDVDRVVAEHGGHAHVEGLLRYSPVLSAAIRDQLADILEEYGFCDDRPLLVQQGRRER